MGTRSGASALVINSYATELVPMVYYCIKPQVQMFYFLSTNDAKNSAKKVCKECLKQISVGPCCKLTVVFIWYMA